MSKKQSLNSQVIEAQDKLKNNIKYVDADFVIELISKKRTIEIEAKATLNTPDEYRHNPNGLTIGLLVQSIGVVLEKIKDPELLLEFKELIKSDILRILEK